MRPGELERFEPAWSRAVARLGWMRRYGRYPHQGDDGPRGEFTYHAPDGSPLIEEWRLEEGMVREIIRVASLLPPDA